MSSQSFDHEGRPIEDGNLQSQPDTGTEESLQSLLQRTESELTGHFPMMVDSVTRLNTVKAGTDRLHYHYTLLNASAEDLDAEATREALTPLVQQQANGMSFLKLLMEKGATISFHYADKDGREITVIDVRA